MSRPPGRDQGMATVEIAVVLPALMLLVAVGISAVSAVTGHLRCLAAAREAARAAARGDPVQEARAQAVRVGPAGAQVTVRFVGDLVIVVVSVRQRQLVGLLPAVQLSGRAVGLREPASAG